MPWTAKQNKVWRAIEHGWNPPGKKFAGVSRDEATKMAHEGIKDEVSRAKKKHAISKKLKKH